MNRPLARLGFGYEWLIIRHDGGMTGPYDHEADARRDAEGVRGTAVVRRLVWCDRMRRRNMTYVPDAELGDPPWWRP